ncbi:MAG TPA: UDP-glucose/GDP-mannose dehydrogenase family protein [Candidatus Limnocylindrales bacterium]|nr:UDP-glucose/GDP-mannose dehydrogenase family protein [Candidatus Limnocylindrales bacterium]
MSRVTIVGTGYVGLSYAAALAELEHEVTALDVNQLRMESLAGGHVPFYEPGLSELVSRGIDSGRLTFTTDYAAAVAGAEYVFMCVGTPQGKDGAADLSQVASAARSIAKHLSPDRLTIIVNKSTLPVGGGDYVQDVVARHARPGAQYAVVSNPEFLREGAAIQDIFQPDRIVLGAEQRQHASLVADLYRAIDAPVLIMGRRSAEMVKYAANAFLATKISFINEVAQMCDELGADVGLVADGIGMDGRIGPRFLHAGLGYGGSCFPKDVAALAHIAERSGVDAQLLRSVQKVNDEVRERFVDRAAWALDGLEGRRIAVWGLAFKENTDDIRESPALAAVEMLWARGAHVVAYDPQAMPAAKRLYPHLETAPDAYAAAQGADAVLVATPWPEFRALSLYRTAGSMKGDLLLDGRNLFDPSVATQAGLRYLGVGRGFVEPAAAARDRSRDRMNERAAEREYAGAA